MSEDIKTNGAFSIRKGARRKRRAPTHEELVQGVLDGNLTRLSQAITLVESLNPVHQQKAQKMLLELMPHTGKAARIGITGVPGVGKSTFIEAFGKYLTGQGLKVAVLAVDPTSSRTGGSILGDKTRMEQLSADPNAFIRPSPSSCTLGGVTRTTRETMAVCEAGGFDVILVETVGVGQSETVVADMVDFFLVLMLPGAGDELQGIKKGVLELADMIAVNKADGNNEVRAKMAAREYRTALHIMKPISPNWNPPVEMISAIEKRGLDTLWNHIESYRTKLTETGELPERRRQQQLNWMWAMVEDRLMTELRTNPQVAGTVPEVEQGVLGGTLTPTLGVEAILSAFRGSDPVC